MKRMLNKSDRARAFAARLSIRDIVERYAFALDARDWDLLASCFHPSVSYRLMNGAIVLNGAAEVVNTLHAVAGYASTCHSISNSYSFPEGQTASGTVHSTAILHRYREGIGSVLTRGLRYEDRYQNRDGEWRIAERTHIPLWQFETAILPDDMLNVRPTS